MKKDQEWESGFSKTCDSCFQSLVTKPELVGSAQFTAFIGVSHFLVLTQKGFGNLVKSVLFSELLQPQRSCNF